MGGCRQEGMRLMMLWFSAGGLNVERSTSDLSATTFTASGRVLRQV